MVTSIDSPCYIFRDSLRENVRRVKEESRIPEAACLEGERQVGHT